MYFRAQTSYCRIACSELSVLYSTMKKFYNSTFSLITIDITTYEEFINFLKKPTAFNLVQSAAPIGYTLRSAIDGRKIGIKTTYTESNKIFK